MAIDLIVTGPTTVVVDVTEVAGGPAGPAGPPGPPSAGAVIVQAVIPPDDPGQDGVQWYDPSSGITSTWYVDDWYADGEIVPLSPTPLVGQEVSVSVGSVYTLIKFLDLPVPYFDGGNAYYAQFPKALAAGWASPDFFPFSIWLSPAQDGHQDRIKAAGITHYNGIEGNAGNITRALAAGLGVMPQSWEYTADLIDIEDGDDDPRVVGWSGPDEPDIYSDLAYVVSEEARLKALNDGRFTWVNVAGGLLQIPGHQQPDTTDDMIRVMDIGSTDAYLYSSATVRRTAVSSPLWPGAGVSGDEARRSAAYGWHVDLLKAAQDPGNIKPVWIDIETARPLLQYSAYQGPWITLPQISGATWSSIRHGARGITFFQHNDNNEDPFYSLSEWNSYAIRGQVTALIAEVTALASVLDGPTYDWDFGDPNIETALKATSTDAYIFAGVALLAPLSVGSSDISQVGTTLEFQFSDTSATGTVSSAITVPDGTELVVAMVSGLHGTNDGFAAMTFTKSGVDTAMTKVPGGDASGASWQSAMFYQLLPDTGASKTLKWAWTGAASSGPRVVVVTFWQGVDLNNPVRDGAGVQSTAHPLNTPTLVETSTLEVADGDLILAACGMYNPDADGGAKVSVWHHMARLGLEEPTHSGVAEMSIATGAPDGDCTVGFENIQAGTEAAVVACVIKAATLQVVTSSIVQEGSLQNLTGSFGNTGNFTPSFTVPVGTDFMIVCVVALVHLANWAESVLTLKGSVLTPMIRVPGGDVTPSASGGWTGAMFYITNPDSGTNGCSWDWIGADDLSNTALSVTFWSGVDTADPVRDAIAVQGDASQFTTGALCLTPVLTNREGDLIVTAYLGYGDSGATIDSWHHGATTLSQLPTVGGFLDGAWATMSVIGSCKVGPETTTGIGPGYTAGIVLRPLAAVTPATPDADPPTTPRTVTTGTFTLPPDLAAATTVEVLNESRTIAVTAGVFTDDFDEEWNYHNYQIPIP